MTAVLKHELRNYFHTLTAYVSVSYTHLTLPTIA